MVKKAKRHKMSKTLRIVLWQRERCCDFMENQCERK